MKLPSFVHVYRTGITSPSGNYYVTTLKVLKLPLIISKTDRKTRWIKFFGLPVFKCKVDRSSDGEKIQNQIAMLTDPAKVPKASGVLRIIQMSGFELLKKFDFVCKKHGLSYWLDFGSLLGAVRHKGFIPWDDDIDVSMMREDWERLLDILGKEFSQDGFFYNIDPFIQIRFQDTTIQLDVFPYDFGSGSWSPDSKIERNFIDRIYTAASSIVYSSEDRISYKTISHTYEEKRQLHHDIVMEGKPARSDGNVFLGFEIPFAGKCKNSFRNEWVFPLKTIMFEGCEFPCPWNPEMILYSQYGDWSVLPKNPPVHFDRACIKKDSLWKMMEVIKNGLS